MNMDEYIINYRSVVGKTKKIIFSTSMSIEKGAVTMEQNKYLVAKNLKEIRLSRSYSQMFVANQLGISQRTITRAETDASVSGDMLKRMCRFYQVPVSYVYEEHHVEAKPSVDLVPEDVAINLLIKNSFISDIQKETIYRYNDKIKKDAVMLREDIERFLPEVIANKKQYSLSDLITCCMAVNQKTLENIIRLI